MPTASIRSASPRRCAAGAPGSTGPMAAAALLAFSAAPLFDAEARIVGTRGIGVDWTEYDEYQGRVATALRRGEVLDHILWRMGQEVLAPRMMQAALGCADERARCRGGRGDRPARARMAPVLLHRAGGAAEEVLPTATALLAEASGPADATGDDGRPIVVAVCHTRVGAHAGLALWRSPGSRGWDHEDKLLVECRRQPDPHGARARGDPAGDGAAGADRSADRPAEPPRLSGGNGAAYRPSGPRRTDRAP